TDHGDQQQAGFADEDTDSAREQCKCAHTHPPLRLPVDGLGEHWDIRRVVGVGRSLPWWQRLSAVLIRLGRARRDGIEVESVGERPYDLTCLSDNTGFAAEPLGSLEAARFGLPTR